jgi:cytochrome P450
MIVRARCGCARAGVRELIDYFIDVLDERESDFGTRRDILSVLLQAEAEGQLSRRGIIGYAILLLTGGNETTTNLIGGMAIALREHPAQLARLADDPALIPNAIEEGLRYCSPVQAVYRRATRDVEIAGQAIPAGSDLALMLGSANHDEAKFDRAEDFIVTRHTGGHTGFGMGVHHCLGAHLARLEARNALGWLVPRLAAFEPRDETVTWNDTWFVRGPERLPYAWQN